eukprot:CAMPEP_0115348888 /NCGR_PEP_ID=MMETSP0270-20121206/95635_1 /TAXON_ID=71861 /ORGANISM="Scrippsiella trochoidea, Strain CCMP3099" /LENGTH=94 /DNA_ID=CAMNT_0002770869 /DNA_START=71 /DNA_END=352 /DNA_ORIENTATION=+
MTSRPPRRAWNASKAPASMLRSPNSCTFAAQVFPRVASGTGSTKTEGAGPDADLTESLGLCSWNIPSTRKRHATSVAASKSGRMPKKRLPNGFV